MRATGGYTLKIPDEIRQCVVFVGVSEIYEKGSEVYSLRATAFFVSVPSAIRPDLGYTYLVTAQHVVNHIKGSPFFVRVNRREGGSQLLKGDHDFKWWQHPTDESVDIAVFPFAPSPEEVEYQSVPVSMFLTDEIIESRNIGVGDEVFITGLFAHVTGKARNIPIVRVGNIAMMPPDLVPTSLGEIEAYLIEARSIGGLSGSPAFVRRSQVWGQGELYLLGLMHGHWDIPPKAKDDHALRDKYEARSTVNMGIAIVVPAKKILEVLYHPELVEMRKKGDEEMKKAVPTTAHPS